MENNNSCTLITILLISNDEESCLAYANKAPEGVKICCCHTDEDSVGRSLSELLPHAVFIILKKGERPGKKNFDAVYRYAADNMVYLGAMGSRLQLNTLKHDAENVTVNFIATPRELRDSILLLRSRRKRHLAALERYASDSRSGKPPVIAVITEDLSQAALCESALSSFSAVNDKGYRLIFISSGISAADYLGENQIIPRLFIFSDGKKHQNTAKTINSLFDLPEYNKIQYILTDCGEAENVISCGLRKKPAAVVRTDGGMLAAAAEKIIKNKG